MRILEITAYFPPSVGGIQYYTHHLSRALAIRGHQVDVLTVNTEDSPAQEVTPEGVRIVRCKLDGFIYRAVISVAFVQRLLAARDYDLYHIHLPFHLGLETAGVASRKNHIPLIATFHGQYVTGSCLYTALAGAYSYFSRLVSMRSAARTIFLTRSYAESIWLPVCIKRRVQTVKTGADLSHFTPQPATDLRAHYGVAASAPIFLFVGNLHRANRYKGVDYLIKAFSIVQKSIQNAYLIIVGGGDLLPALQISALEHGLAQSVLFTGMVPHEALPAYYATADALVLPSIHGPENSPLVLFEAMACGRPAIASNLPGLCEIVRHGQTGLLVEPRDVVSLAEAMVRLATDKDTGRRMGDCARAIVQDYAWAHCAQDMETIMREVIDR
jgi:glycosyltransferase involved in cell wall biosynthesis